MRSVAPSAYLDVRNVMWLLAAMVFVVAPHLLRMPYWVVVFFLPSSRRAWIEWAAINSRAAGDLHVTRPGRRTFFQYTASSGARRADLLVLMAR